MGRRAEQQEYAEAEQDEHIGNLEQQVAAAAPSFSDQLSRLSTLHEQGALTDDEFTAAKAKLME